MQGNNKVIDHLNKILYNELRANLPKISDWPTFPQVFINGELVGGADIIAQMHESGELKKLIDSIES